MVRASAKMCESFVHFDILHRTMSMQKLYYVTMTYFLKVKNGKKLYPINGRR